MSGGPKQIENRQAENHVAKKNQIAETCKVERQVAEKLRARKSKCWKIELLACLSFDFLPFDVLTF